MAKRRREQSDEPRHGEDALGEVKPVRVRLENGQTYLFDPRRELQVPKTRDAVWKAAQVAPQRKAFWADATEIAMSRVRRAERELARIRGEMHFVVREHLQKSDEWDTCTDRMVEAGIAMQSKAQDAQEKLDNAWKRYGRVRAIRDAVSEWCDIVKRMVRAYHAGGGPEET